MCSSHATVYKEQNGGWLCIFPKTIEYPICVTRIVLNGKNAKLNMAALSNEASPSEQKSQSLIGKVSASLQLALDVPVAIEIVSVLRHALGLRTGRFSLINKLFITPFEQNKQHLWYSCCQISLVISNMKFNCKLGDQFWRIWCFPIQRDRSCTCMPERHFKDGRWVTRLALKGLWYFSLLWQTTAHYKWKCAIYLSVGL